MCVSDCVNIAKNSLALNILTLRLQITHPSAGITTLVELEFALRSIQRQDVFQFCVHNFAQAAFGLQEVVKVCFGDLHRFGQLPLSVSPLRQIHLCTISKTREHGVLLLPEFGEIKYHTIQLRLNAKGRNAVAMVSVFRWYEAIELLFVPCNAISRRTLIWSHN